MNPGDADIVGFPVTDPALDGGDRLAIGLRWFAELGEAEMAEVLGVPRGTVKSRLSRAMGRLREIMAEGRAHD